MKNRELIKSLAALIMVLSMAGLAVAGSTASLTVSCTIPVMPGLNAPLIEQDALKTQANAKAERKIETQQELVQDGATLPQQDTNREEVVTEDGNSAIIVKTYYSR